MPVDLWSDGLRDFEEERQEELLTAAITASAALQAVAIEAESEDDFENRIALLDDRIDAVASNFAIPGSADHLMIKASLPERWFENWATLQESRRARAQRENALRAHARAKERAGEGRVSRTASTFVDGGTIENGQFPILYEVKKKDDFLLPEEPGFVWRVSISGPSIGGKDLAAGSAMTLDEAMVQAERSARSYVGRTYREASASDRHITPQIASQSHRRQPLRIHMGAAQRQPLKIHMGAARSRIPMRVNFTAPNRRHAQAYESPYVSAAREVVRTQSLQKIDGIILDLFTASAIVQVYDAVSENKRDQLNQLSLTELADLALKVLSRTASNSFPPKDDIEGGGAEQDSPASPSAPGVGENLSEAKSINDGDVILESNGSGVITYRVTEARPDGNSILLSVIKNESEEMTLRVPGGEKLQVLPGSSAADAPPPTKEDSGDGEEEGSKDPEDANEPGDEDEDEGKGEDEDSEKDEEDKK